MAAALSLTFGRTGALVGNLVFGFLIDLNCVVPIVLFSAMLLGRHIMTVKRIWSFLFQPLPFFRFYCISQ